MRFVPLEVFQQAVKIVDAKLNTRWNKIYHLVLGYLEERATRDSIASSTLSHQVGLADEPEPLTPPMIYELYVKVKMSGLPFWEGGYADQPYLLMEDFEMCRRAEIANSREQQLIAQMQRELEKINSG